MTDERFDRRRGRSVYLGGPYVDKAGNTVSSRSPSIGLRGPSDVIEGPSDGQRGSVCLNGTYVGLDWFSVGRREFFWAEKGPSLFAFKGLSLLQRHERRKSRPERTLTWPNRTLS